MALSLSDAGTTVNTFASESRNLRPGGGGIVTGTFFQEKQAPAKLKHAILHRYVRGYFSKTGSRHRTGLYIDGYAGPGTYDDDAPGSPVVAVETLKPLAGDRDVRFVFIEKRAPTFRALQGLCAEPGFEATQVLHGEVRDHLDDVLTDGSGMPLLAFFDPFGMGLPLDLLHKVLRRARSGRQRVATEVLINFSRPGVYRNAGKLTGQGTDPAYLRARATILSNMDDHLGGDWWRPIWCNDPTKGAVDTILAGYKKRLALPGWTVYDVPVGTRWEGPPVYHLLLLTQHDHGRWTFNECVSNAMGDYYDWCHRVQPSLESQEQRDVRWQDTIAGNVEALIDGGSSFRVVDRMSEVFGETFGYARAKHLREVLKGLHSRGVLADKPVGELREFVVSRGTNAQTKLL